MIIHRTMQQISLIIVTIYCRQQHDELFRKINVFTVPCLTLRLASQVGMNPRERSEHENLGSPHCESPELGILDPDDKKLDAGRNAIFLNVFSNGHKRSSTDTS